MSIILQEDGISFHPERMQSVGDAGLILLKWDLLANASGKVTQALGSSALGEGLEWNASYDESPVAEFSIRPNDGRQWVKQLLADMGLSILVSAEIDTLTGDQVDGLYPTKHGRPWYPDYKASLVGTPAAAFIVGGMGVAAQLETLKGETDGYDGIRGVLSPRLTMPSRLDFDLHTGIYADPEAWADMQRQLAQQDLVHTAENESDTLSGTAVLFGRDDIQSVVMNYPRLESQFSALIA